MSSLAIDIESTRAFVDALTERLEAEEFESLLVGEKRESGELWVEMRRLRVEVRRLRDRAEAQSIRCMLDEVEDGEELTALDQLRLFRQIEDLQARHSDLVGPVSA